MSQSDLYKNRNQVDRLHDLIGADVPRDLLRMGLVSQDTNLTVEQANAPNPATEETLADRATEATVQAILDAVATEATLSSLDSTDFATQTTLAALAAALDSNAGDALRFTPTATLPVEQQTPIAVDSNTTLAVEQQTPVLVNSDGPLDVSGATVTAAEATPSADRDAWNGTTLTASTSASKTMAATGADRVRGRVVSTGSYDVDLEWLDGNGNVIFTDSVGQGVAGGTPTDIDALAISRDVKVVVTDTSAADQTLDGVLSLA